MCPRRLRYTSLAENSVANKGIRIGVDVGGTKIEALAIAADGAELLRYRVPTPRGDYDATVGCGGCSGLTPRTASSAPAPPSASAFPEPSRARPAW